MAVGWGPERPLYYDDTYPDALTFNSTAENANVGDERNWVVVKPAANLEAGSWSDNMEVEPDGVYLVRLYIRLDGPSTHDATDTKLVFNLPTCTGHRVGVEGFLSANNVFPQTIWDGAEFWSRRDFNLALVPDSAVLYNNFGEFPLATNSLVTSTGVLVGNEQMDGRFRAGYSNSAYVYFEVKAQVAPD